MAFEKLFLNSKVLQFLALILFGQNLAVANPAPTPLATETKSHPLIPPHSAPRPPWSLDTVSPQPPTIMTTSNCRAARSCTPPSHICLSIAHYLDHKYVVLKTVNSFFHQPLKEKEHVEKLLKLQKQQCGWIFLQDIMKPENSFRLGWMQRSTHYTWKKAFKGPDKNCMAQNCHWQKWLSFMWLHWDPLPEITGKFIKDRIRNQHCGTVGRFKSWQIHFQSNSL